MALGSVFVGLGYMVAIAVPQEIIPADHRYLAWKGRWGTHISAFQFYPLKTVEQIMQFISRVAPTGNE